MDRRQAIKAAVGTIGAVAAFGATKVPPSQLAEQLAYRIVSIKTAKPTSHYNGLRVATVKVLGEKASAQVVDHMGCLFVGPVNELIGREGFAFWGIAQSLKAGAKDGDASPAHWAAYAVSCAAISREAV